MAYFTMFIVGIGGAAFFTLVVCAAVCLATKLPTDDPVKY